MLKRGEVDIAYLLEAPKAQEVKRDPNLRLAFWAYSGYPDIDVLFKQQAVETDRKKREALLHQIQRLVYERVRYGPIFEYI